MKKHTQKKAHAVTKRKHRSQCPSDLMKRKLISAKDSVLIANPEILC